MDTVTLYMLHQPEDFDRVEWSMENYTEGGDLRDLTLCADGLWSKWRIPKGAPAIWLQLSEKDPEDSESLKVARDGCTLSYEQEWILARYFPRWETLYAFCWYDTTGVAN